MNLNPSCAGTPAGGPIAVTTHLRNSTRNAVSPTVEELSGGVRVLWTGSRSWEDDALTPYLSDLAMELMMGVADAVGSRTLAHMHGAARGFDRQVAQMCVVHGWGQEVYPVMPAEYAEHGNKGPLARDRRMIKNKPTLTIGLPAPGRRSAGTWYTIRQSVRAGIPTFVARCSRTGWLLEQATPRHLSGLFR